MCHVDCHPDSLYGTWHQYSAVLAQLDDDCLRQGGYVIVVVCLSVRNFAQKLLHEIFREGWQWANEQMMKFWRRYGSGLRIWIWICIVTLVRRALVEVCTVAVLLVKISSAKSAKTSIYSNSSSPPVCGPNSWNHKFSLEEFPRVGNPSQRFSFMGAGRKSKETRWLYCVECKQYSTRQRSASNIHHSGMLRKNKVRMERPSNILISLHRKRNSIITNIPLFIS